MDRRLGERVGHAAGAGVVRVARLGGGCVGQVWRVELADGRVVVAKAGASGEGKLDV